MLLWYFEVFFFVRKYILIIGNVVLNLFVGVFWIVNEERKVGDFLVFNDFKKCYSIFNLKYLYDIFDWFSGLVEFNILFNE